MDKIAMVKAAEVRGVLACLVDNELVKVASEDAFEKMAEIVAEGLEDDYDLQQVIDEASAVIEAEEALANMTEEEIEALMAEAEAGEGTSAGGEEGAAAAEEAAAAAAAAAEEDPEKQASEKDLKVQYADLVMAKEAGDISENYFTKEANKVTELLKALGAKAQGAGQAAGAKAQGAAQATGQAAKNTGGKFVDGLTFDRLRAARRSGGSPDFVRQLRNQGLRQSAGAYGTAAGGAGLAGLAAGKGGQQ